MKIRIPAFEFLTLFVVAATLFVLCGALTPYITCNSCGEYLTPCQKCPNKLCNVKMEKYPRNPNK